MKRGFDIFISLIVLLLSLPLFVLVAIAIKLDSPGPVFFKQKRVGQNRRKRQRLSAEHQTGERRGHNEFGKPFYMYKFRTMVEKPPTPGPSLTAANDQRITRVGQFIRRWKIDEIPQFFNVLKGEMSIVGPRPEVPDYVQHYADSYLKVLDVKPGITDLASIQYRNESQLLAQCENIHDFYIQTIMPQKLKLNLHYINRRSLRYDTLLILQTLKAILFN